MMVRDRAVSLFGTAWPKGKEFREVSLKLIFLAFCWVCSSGAAVRNGNFYREDFCSIADSLKVVSDQTGCQVNVLIRKHSEWSIRNVSGWGFSSINKNPPAYRNILAWNWTKVPDVGHKVQLLSIWRGVPEDTPISLVILNLIRSIYAVTPNIGALGGVESALRYLYQISSQAPLPSRQSSVYPDCQKRGYLNSSSKTLAALFLCVGSFFVCYWGLWNLKFGPQ